MCDVRSECISLADSNNISPVVEELVFNLSQQQSDPTFWYLRKMLFVINSTNISTTGLNTALNKHQSLVDPNNWSEQIAEKLPTNKSFIKKHSQDRIPEDLWDDQMVSIIQTRYLSLGLDQTTITNIVLGILSYSYLIALESNINVSFANKNFRTIVRTKHNMILASFENNSAKDNLFDGVSDGTIKGFNLAFMTRKQLLPKLYEQRIEELKNYQAGEDGDILDPDEMEDGFYECDKCGEKKTTFESRQIRSADEPATIFVTCHRCRYTWKDDQ